MLFSLSEPKLAAVESIVERIDRLIAAAIARGEHDSAASVLKAAKLSTGWLSEFRGRVAKNPEATIQASTAEALAQALAVPVGELYGEAPAPPDDDVYPERSFAVSAARALGLPEAAIRRVLAEDPGADQPRLFWFRRIETEAERDAPAAGGMGPGTNRAGRV